MQPHVRKLKLKTNSVALFYSFLFFFFRCLVRIGQIGTEGLLLLTTTWKTGHFVDCGEFAKIAIKKENATKAVPPTCHFRSATHSNYFKNHINNKRNKFS